jgi:hypothetical protein
MKRIILILFSATILLACSKETTVELVKFTDTGCDRNSLVPDTKAGSDSQLILSYSDEGLVITRTNAMLNCSISQGGISCDVSSDENVIECHVYETQGKTLKCMCPVKNMTTTVGGLRINREYVLYYSCDGDFAPISFTYSKNLNMVLDADLYKL